MTIKAQREAPRVVWIVTRWTWGGGGDDDRVIERVFSSEAPAHVYAEEIGGQVERHEVARPLRYRS